MRWITNILLLIVMLASPLAMHPDAASASSTAPAAMAVHGMDDHCPPKDDDGKARGLAGCAMACASALPAIELPEFRTEAPLLLAPDPSLAKALSGLAPEAAIPPPRSA